MMDASVKIFHIFSSVLQYCNITSILGFSSGSVGKEYACNEGDADYIPELGRSPGKRAWQPLQYFGLENPKDRGTHGVTESDMTEHAGMQPVFYIIIKKKESSYWTNVDVF